MLQRNSRVREAAWKEGFALALSIESKMEEESDVARRLRVDFNQKQGTFGKALLDCKTLRVVKVFRSNAAFHLYFHDFELLKRCNDICMTTTPLSSSEGERDANLAVMGLGSGATAEDIRAAYCREARVWHPDKPSGDHIRFIAVKDAYEFLMGTAPQVDSRRLVLVAPKCNASLDALEIAVALSTPQFRDLPPDVQTRLVDLMSYDEAEREHTACVLYRNELQEAMAVATKRLHLLSSVKEAHARRDRRRAAEDFMQRFRTTSASSWNETVLVKGWFRPEEVTMELDAEGMKRYKEAWGPDLRTGNEDLDPYVSFQGFLYLGWRCSKKLVVKVGADKEDATAHGVLLTLPLVRFLHTKVYGARLQSMGFDLELADELHDARAWDQLQAKHIVTCRSGGLLNLDVRTTKRLYDNLQAQHDAVAVVQKARKHQELEETTRRSSRRRRSEAVA